MCNPKMQARFLSEQGVELYISCGLCVGHDAIFNKNCPGPVTNLAAKDRLLGHNPLPPSTPATGKRNWVSWTKTKYNLTETKKPAICSHR
jgi:hypothetical protein